MYESRLLGLEGDNSTGNGKKGENESGIQWKNFLNVIIKQIEKKESEKWQECELKLRK